MPFRFELNPPLTFEEYKQAICEWCKLTRMLAGYTVFDLVDDDNFYYSKSAITKVELGIRFPSDSYIEAMCRVIPKGMRRTINREDMLSRVADRRRKIK